MSDVRTACVCVVSAMRRWLQIAARRITRPHRCSGFPMIPRPHWVSHALITCSSCCSHAGGLGNAKTIADNKKKVWPPRYQHHWEWNYRSGNQIALGDPRGRCCVNCHLRELTPATHFVKAADHRNTTCPEHRMLPWPSVLLAIIPRE